MSCANDQYRPPCNSFTPRRSAGIYVELDPAYEERLTVPLATALGQSGTPGEAAGFGLLDAGTARDLLAAAGRSPHTRWCVTVLHPDGTATAHGCATGRHPPPPGPDPPGPQPPATGPPGTANLGTTCDTSGSPDQGPPLDTKAQDYLRSLGVRLTLIARGNCDHRHAETGTSPAASSST